MLSSSRNSICMFNLQNQLNCIKKKPVNKAGGKHEIPGCHYYSKQKYTEYTIAEVVFRKVHIFSLNVSLFPKGSITSISIVFHGVLCNPGLLYLYCFAISSC